MRRVLTAALGSVLAPLNSTMVAVALPRIMTDLELTLAQASLLVTSYLACMALLQLGAGRLGDRWGRRRLILGALLGYTLTALGAFADSFPVLLWFRVQQALCGAVLVPNLMAWVRESVEARSRGRTFGLIGTATSLAAAVGPWVGGLLVAAWGWRAIFPANLAVLLPLLVLAWVEVYDDGGRADAPARGAALQLLKNRSFAGAVTAIGLSNLAMYMVLIALPLLLARQGWTSERTGVALLTMSGSTAALSAAGGHLSDRWGRRLPAMAGLTLTTLGLLGLTLWGSGGLYAGLAMLGAGLGLASAGLQTAAAEAAGPEVAGISAAIASTVRYVGSITSTSAIPLLMGYGWPAIFGTAGTAALISIMGAKAIDARAPGRPSPQR